VLPGPPFCVCRAVLSSNNRHKSEFRLAKLQIVDTIKSVYVWDEAKRKSNLKKQGLDFRDAHLVYENPDKCTYDASRNDESRLMDVALAVVKGSF